MELGQIPMTPSLADALRRASEVASGAGAREVSLEHILFALCDEPDAIAVLDSNRIDIPKLKIDTAAYLSSGPPGLLPSPHALKVSADATRILEAAAQAARGGRRRDINGAIVLAAIVGDGASFAAHLLQMQGMTFDGAVQALQRSLAARDAPGVSRGHSPTEDVLARARERVASRSQPTLRDIVGDANRASPLPTPVAASRPEPSREAEPATAPPSAPTSSDDATPAAPVDQSAAGEQAATAQPAAVEPPLDAVTDPATGEPEPALMPAPEAAPPNAEPQPVQPPVAESTPRPFGADVHEPTLPVPGLPPEPLQPHADQQWTIPTPAPPLQLPVGGARPRGYEPGFASRTPAELRHEPDFRPMDFGPSQSPFPPYGAPPFGLPNLDIPRPIPVQPPPIPAPRRPEQAPLEYFPGEAPPQFPGRTGGDFADLHRAEDYFAPTASGVTAPAPSSPPGSMMLPDHVRASTFGRTAAPATDPGQMAENIPRAMRMGVTHTVEIRIGKQDAAELTSGLEGGGPVWMHDVDVTKAMSVRLRAPEGGFFIETASPETQWIEKQLVAANDFASWRFLVTPQRRGASRLQIVVSARTVGPDGVSAETALPDQVIDVKVRTNFGRVFARASGWIAAAVAGGALARFGEAGLDVANVYVSRFMN